MKGAPGDRGRRSCSGRRRGPPLSGPDSPEVLSVDHANGAFGLGTRPGDGRKPTTLQNAAGLRREPPVSEPLATGTSPHANATAAPPDEPPQVFVRSYGLRVAPKTGLNVWEPAPNSGVLVLPMVIAPARSIRSTTMSFSVGTLSLYRGEPNVVRIPRVSIRSLCATGSPCSGPSIAPRACISSALAAAAAASSGTRVTIALTFGLTRSICARCAASASRAESFFARISRAISTCAHETHRRSAGLDVSRARKEWCRREADENVATAGMVLTHVRNATPAAPRRLPFRRRGLQGTWPLSCPMAWRGHRRGTVPDQIDSADSVTNALAPGDRLGPYEILAKLGEGGMGSRRLLSSAIRSVAGQG